MREKAPLSGVLDNIAQTQHCFRAMITNENLLVSEDNPAWTITLTGQKSTIRWLTASESL
jgi:hypothetical protein